MNRRTKFNLCATAVIGLVGVGIAATLEPQQSIDVDADYATQLQELFPDLAQAAQHRGKRFVSYTHADDISAMDTLLTAEDSVFEAERQTQLGNAAVMFQDAAADGLYIKSVICDKSYMVEGALQCTMTMTERGGIVEPGKGAYALEACQTERTTVLLTQNEGGDMRLFTMGEMRQAVANDDRLSSEFALARRVNMDDFSAERPHRGPRTLMEISVNDGAYQHNANFRSGNRRLGDEQLSAERVFASFGECFTAP